jgi:hypothetical protein
MTRAVHVPYTHPELTASHTALHSTSSLKTCDLVSHRHVRTS